VLNRVITLIALSAIAACAKSPSGPTPPIGPQVACPGAVSLVSPTGTALRVVYGSPTVVGGTPPVTTSCSPASGSSFGLGTTSVTCAAVDAQQRSSTCHFAVIVQPPVRIRLTKFVAFGDSITLGEDGNTVTLAPTTPWPIVLVDKAYPLVLQQQLASRYTTQALQVANAGRGGEWAGDAATLTRFSELLGTRLYESVLIMEGTNDLSTANPTQIQPAIDNLRAMLSDARSRNIRPYLATIPPIDPSKPRGSRFGASLVTSMNDRIRALAAAEGVTLVDVHQAFGGNLALLDRDGLHPNADGLARIADAFFVALRGTLELPSTPTASVPPWGVTSDSQ